MEHSSVVPMRLFATWESDSASSDCVPRLCSLALNRLTIFHPLEQDMNSIVIAAKLQGFKRTLRSNDITVHWINGIVDIDLDLSFTLQYPHFVKKMNNKLMIMVQRRKKYKSRPMLGYKTLASGCINLTQVLQGGAIRELPLYSEDKEEANRSHKPAAQLYIFSLSTQPVEQEEFRSKRLTLDQTYSDDDGEEWTGNEEDGTTDSECVVDEHSGAVPSSVSWSKLSSIIHSHPNSSVRLAMHQKKLKQKFVALLKKFKVSEEEAAENSFGSKKPSRKELQALFEELESLNDSDGDAELDSASVRSIPKPSLRTYFSGDGGDKVATVQDDFSDDSKESTGRKPLTWSSPNLSVDRPL